MDALRAGGRDPLARRAAKPLRGGTSLSDAASQGVRQYVILGAGYDTFAYRQPAWAASLRTFEVDHLASQQAKIERLRSVGMSFRRI